jgi:hypothetical protein
MKNTDPPHRNTKASKMTPEVSKFIESMGMYFENMGIPRIGGRMLGLLMISHDPLSAEDIGSILKVSRGSISTNTRTLLAAGLVEKISLPGERTTFFVYPDTGLEQRMVAGIQSTMIFRKISEQGLATLNPEHFARHRLEDAVKWSDMLLESFHTVIADWHARQQSVPEKKRQNNPSKLTEDPFRVTKNVPQKT